MKGSVIIFGCSLLAIATTAQAQAAVQEDQPATQSVASPNEAPTAAATDDGGVGDIVVTANRREERLQDVPIAVTLVDGDQLTRQNVNAVEDLSRSAPALSNAGPPGFGALSIRGIGGLSF